MFYKRHESPRKNNVMMRPDLPEGIENDEVEFILATGLTLEEVSDYLKLPITVTPDAVLHGECPVLSSGIGGSNTSR